MGRVRKNDKSYWIIVAFSTLFLHEDIKNGFVPVYNVLKLPKLWYFVLLYFQSFPLGSFLMVLDIFIFLTYILYIYI